MRALSPGEIEVLSEKNNSLKRLKFVIRRCDKEATATRRLIALLVRHAAVSLFAQLGKFAQAHQKHTASR